ncbi:MAG: VCBS repeat-containing protein [Planctomycetes bacterium]|nr:VCBS repeat-containing protein [Planctomycetota bacterium]
MKCIVWMTLALTFLVSTGSAQVPAFESTGAWSVSFGSPVTGYGYGLATTDDVNGDGWADLVLADTVFGEIQIRPGLGDGTFASPIGYPSGGIPVAVTTADLNEDGMPDIACCNAFGSSIGLSGGSVSVLLSASTGGFAPVQVYPAGSKPVRVTAGDLDLDGHVDLVIVDEEDSTVSLMAGNGTGGLAAPLVNFIEIDDSLESVTIDDLDQNGIPDLIVPCPLQDLVAVLLGTGGGQYQPAMLYDAGDNPGFIAIDDYDEDGWLDVAANNRNGGSVSILYGIGFGLLAPYQEIVIGSTPTLIRDLDLTGSGDPALAVTLDTEHAVRLLWGLESSPVPQVSTLALTFAPDYALTDDLDADGRMDIVAISKIESVVEVWLNRSTPPGFIRGDLDDDATITVADGVTLLAVLFQGATEDCPDRADTNDDGALDIADAVTLFESAVGAGALPAPTACGPDPTPDSLPPCDAGCP